MILAANRIADTEQQDALYAVGIPELSEMVRDARKTCHHRDKANTLYLRRCAGCGDQPSYRRATRGVTDDVWFGYTYVCQTPACARRAVLQSISATRTRLFEKRAALDRCQREYVDYLADRSMRCMYPGHRQATKQTIIGLVDAIANIQCLLVEQEMWRDQLETRAYDL